MPIQYFVSTILTGGARSLHPDEGLCQVSIVETIMVGVNLTILDQIAKFFILLSDAPAYWFALNTSCDHACHLSKRLGMDEYD